MKTLTWQEFKDRLMANAELHLQFKYADDKWVDAAYHITEIKQAPITSVDCGGVVNAWTEIIVQLYEPLYEKKNRPMTVGKALSIINVVEKALPLNPNGIVKIEFGNSKFNTRQMLPNLLIVDGGDFVVDLRPDTVQCKAIERGGSCGTDEKAEDCCPPANDIKPKMQLKNLAKTVDCCTPASGCC